MTYFPSPDPDQLYAAMNGHSPFVQSPSAPEDSSKVWNSDLSDNPVFVQPVPGAIAYSWPSPEPQGLGLLHVPATTDGIYQNSLTVAEPTLSLGMAHRWPSQTTSSHFAAHLHDARREPWTGSCDPRSTLMPSALWEPPLRPSPTPTIVFDASPNLSVYSLSSCSSTVSSSPYARSEGHPPSCDSPRIKAEEPTDDRVKHNVQRLSNTSLLRQSRSGSPRECSAQRSASNKGRRAAGSLRASQVPYGSDDEDVKPNISRHRSGLRRLFSSSEALSESFEDRQKRGFTKPENANCACDQCGKLFQRSYNLKAHMDTHDPHRDQPHACSYTLCDKRFVRRTDLVRHEQSVHLKTRNYVCPLCHSSFSRKDTLRRHIDDGCPRRLEVKRRIHKVRSPSRSSAARKSSTQHHQHASIAPSPF